MSRHLVQILLPLADSEGRSFDEAMFQQVKTELAERFGGATAFTQSPAEGLWREGAEGTEHDRIVIFEAMTDAVDEGWWRDYRRDLERRFRQDEIVVRAMPIQLL